MRDRGVYLITGGLGGVGLTLADYLARSVNARLVLIGRHGLPDRKEWASYLASHDDDDRVSRQIHVVDALERAGAEVTVLAADVTNVAQMRSAVQEARRRYGRLDGVIHAAGVPGGGVIQLKTSEAAAAVMAPKVAGTQALSQAVAGLELDFFVLCSSSIALFGGGGQVDYCAANNYLDAFAREYARRTGTPTISINWDGWQQVGMAVNTMVPGHMAREREELLRRSITPEEGVEAFRRILAHCTIPQIVVCTVPLASRARRDGDGRRPGAARREGLLGSVADSRDTSGRSCPRHLLRPPTRSNACCARSGRSCLVSRRLAFGDISSSWAGTRCWRRRSCRASASAAKSICRSRASLSRRPLPGWRNPAEC